MANLGFQTEELIQLMVDTIANKEYAKLVSSIPPKLSWASFIDAEPTAENACLGFGTWLGEQLAMWEERSSLTRSKNPAWRISTKQGLKRSAGIWCVTTRRALENRWIFGLK